MSALLSVLHVNEVAIERRMNAIYGGTGEIRVSRFFRSENVAAPLLIATYRIPPGASEGMHTHGRGDAECGWLDEFYYVISGQGTLNVGTERLEVATGDYVFVPNGIPRGIVNSSETADLHLHIVAQPPSPPGADPDAGFP